MRRKRHLKKFKRSQCFLTKIIKLKNVRFLRSLKKVLLCLCFKIIIDRITNHNRERSNKKQSKGILKIRSRNYGNSTEFMKDFGQIRISIVILKILKLSFMITL